MGLIPGCCRAEQSCLRDLEERTLLLLSQGMKVCVTQCVPHSHSTLLIVLKCDHAAPLRHTRGHVCAVKPS
jgi:hypothetical protein